MKLHQFRVTAPARPGPESEVVVDDEPWHKAYRIKSVAVTHTTGEVTQLFVTLAGGGLIEGEGIVTQIVETPSAGPAEWLDAIDPDELAEAVSAALNSPDYDGAGMEALVLQVLKEHARGQQ